MNAQRPWPVRSAEEVRELFANGGFRVEELSDAPRGVTAGQHRASAGRQPDGPAVSGSGKRLQIIATRL